MADVELDGETLAAYLDVVDGRRVIVLETVGSEDRAVLVLPTRDPSGPVRRLGWQLERIADEVRGSARHDLHRGGLVLVYQVPEWRDGRGGVSGAG